MVKWLFGTIKIGYTSMCFHSFFSEPEYKPVSFETHVPRSLLSKDLLSLVYVPSQAAMKREDSRIKQTAIGLKFFMKLTHCHQIKYKKTKITITLTVKYTVKDNLSIR